MATVSTEGRERILRTDRIAVVILTTRRADSSDFDSVFQPVRGRPVIRFLVDRLIAGWSEADPSYVILVHDQPQIVQRFRSEFGSTEIEVITTSGSWPLEMLAAYAETTVCETLVI